MKRPVSTFCLMALAAATGVASAGEKSQVPLLTIPASALVLQEDAAPAPKGVEPKEAAKKAKPIELYERVKIRDPDHIAPCAEKMIIKVRDPCWKRDPCVCGPQEPRCVFVSICVPKVVACCEKAAACGPPTACQHKCCACNCRHRPLKHICTANGRYQRFDYGRYRVEVRVLHDYIDVDYDD